MELRQLRYFLKIAELGSFSKASLALHIAQPALSHQVSRLEEELGHALLLRKHSGVQMTEQGQAFYSQAQRILKEIDDLPNVVNRSAAQLRGTVAVGLPQSTALHYAMPLLAEVRRRHDGIRLEIFDEISGNLLRNLHTGKLDVAVFVSDDDALLVDATPLMDEELFFVTSSRHPASVSMGIGALADVPLTLPGMHHGVRSLVEEAVRAHGRTLPTPVIVANSMSIMRHAIAEGEASSIMPWAAVSSEIRAGTIRTVPLDPPLTRRIYVCTSKDGELSLSARAVCDALVDVTRQRVRSGEWIGVRLV